MIIKLMIALMQTINFVFTAYFYLILIRCLLSWIPNLSASNPFVAFICRLTDWYLDLFRRIIPPFGGIDFSPIVAVFALSIINMLVLWCVSSLMSLLGAIFG